MHLRRFASVTTFLRALALALAVAGAAGVRPAGATPPRSPIDLQVRLLDEAVPGRPLRFEVELEPLVAGERLRLRVRLPRGVELSGLDTLSLLADASAGTRHRLTGVLRGAPRARHHVALLAELDAPGRRDVHPWRGVLLAGRGAARARACPAARSPTCRWRRRRPPIARAATWTASGRFLYRDRLQDLSGFTGAEPDRPARRVDVQIIDATTSAVLATGATDGDGFYSIPVSDTQVRSVQARMVSLSSGTPGLLLDVRNNSTQRLAYTVGGPVVAGTRSGREPRLRPGDGPARRRRRGVQRLRRAARRLRLLRPAAGRRAPAPAPDGVLAGELGRRLVLRPGHERHPPARRRGLRRHRDRPRAGPLRRAQLVQRRQPGRHALHRRQLPGPAPRVVRGLGHVLRLRRAPGAGPRAAGAGVHRHAGRSGPGQPQLLVRDRGPRRARPGRRQRGRRRLRAVGHHRRRGHARPGARRRRRRAGPSRRRPVGRDGERAAPAGGGQRVARGLLGRLVQARVVQGIRQRDGRGLRRPRRALRRGRPRAG